MKQLRELLPSQDFDNQLVDYYASTTGYQSIIPSVMASDFRCPFCGCSRYVIRTEKDGKRLWICLDLCAASKLPRSDTPISAGSTEHRSVAWSQWCSIMKLGDKCHAIAFEGIQQVPAKVDFLIKFSKSPSGLVLMLGRSGAGKSYACLGLCELFTRNDPQATFITQAALMSHWLPSSRGDGLRDFLDRVETTPLLVVDDFGASDPSPGFLGYFMDLINTRMQWTTRGTVINTNLSFEKLARFCGEALIDRLRTAQQMIFDGESRR